MRVLVTGHKGYIGVHLVDLLKQHGHTVTGVDLDLFAGCAWETCTAADRELIADVRALDPTVLEGHDAVCHLAAISNDPMGDLDEALTLSVNRDASIRLARLCKQAGVPRYLFSGSCSVYGKGATLDLDEGAELNPLTAYARSKIETEAAVRPLADDGFSPVYLRNATAYGHSPMLRIDLVVNNLLACAHALGEIRIMSDGSPVAAADALPRHRGGLRGVPGGASRGRAQRGREHRRQRRELPGARRGRPGEAAAAQGRHRLHRRGRRRPRDYRVNFDLLGRLLPEFRLSYTLESGMEELHQAYPATASRPPIFGGRNSCGCARSARGWGSWRRQPDADPLDRSQLVHGLLVRAGGLAAAGHDVTVTLRSQGYDGLRGQRVASLADGCERLHGLAFGDDRFVQLVASRSWDMLCLHGAQVEGYRSPDFDVASALAANTRRAAEVVPLVPRLLVTGSVFEPGAGRGGALPAISPYGLSKAFTSETFRYLCDHHGVSFGRFVIANPFGPMEEPRFTSSLVRSVAGGRDAAGAHPRLRARQHPRLAAGAGLCRLRGAATGRRLVGVARAQRLPRDAGSVCAAVRAGDRRPAGDRSAAGSAGAARVG